MNDYVIIIPARYASTRFPGKPLVNINGKPLIRHVWDKCCIALPSEQVYVATESDTIAGYCKSVGIQVLMTDDTCLTGTDRLWQAAKQIKAENIVDVQGDEPLVSVVDILDVIESHRHNPYRVHCGMCLIENEEDFLSPSVPKIVTGKRNELLYMSRAPIPSSKIPCFPESYRQVCIWAMTKDLLKQFATAGKKTPLEQQEDLELLRFLELGCGVDMVPVTTSSIAVDHPSDIDKVVEQIDKRKGYKTWIFDCDGVLLDSNQAKSDAMWMTANSHFGKEEADKFVAYNQASGGINRFTKMKHLHEVIAGLSPDQDKVNELVAEYGDICNRLLLQCPLTPGVAECLSSIHAQHAHAYAHKLVVSGGLTEEVHEVLRYKGLDKYFWDIYGSPATKDEILEGLVQNVQKPCVLVGDSLYDMQVAQRWGLDFIFMARFSEFFSWRKTIRKNVIWDLRELI